MKIVKDPFEFHADFPSAVTIGKYDGIHRGHQELVRRTVEDAKSRKMDGECRSVVLTFDMSPVMILSKKERRRMLESMGVDILIECSFGPKIITTTAEAFVKELLSERLKAVSVTAGSDFRFGYMRQGDDELLKRMGKELGFTTRVVPEVMHDGKKISSSDIREAVMSGNMEMAETLLGFPYFMRGRIIHGKRLGRTIGVPTANMIPDKSKLLPPNGVYFTESEIGGALKRGITNIGTKPTVDGHFIGVETSYFELNEDLYGEELEVAFRHFSRPEKKFDSLVQLKEQIGKDRALGEAYFALI